MDSRRDARFGDPERIRLPHLRHGNPPAFDRGIGLFNVASLLAFGGLAGGIACRSAE